LESDSIIGAVLLLLGIAAFILFVAAETGVIAGVRERALQEPAESRLETLRRLYQERQLTLASLTLARNLALVGVTAVAVFLVIREAGQSWTALAITAVVAAVGFVVVQAVVRSITAQNPSRYHAIVRPVATAARFALRWPVRLLEAPTAALTRAWRRPRVTNGGGIEDLSLLSELEQAGASGLMEEERQMIRGVIELEFTAVREIMVPRPDIVAIEVNSDITELARLMVERGYSRIPVYEGNIDHILGIAHGKEVMRHLTSRRSSNSIRDIIRPAFVVPESKKVHELLTEMRQRQASIAIVVDEYGGTAGIVTLEDLLEEIVGEIRDEFDVEERPVQLLTENEVIVDGRVGIDELNEMFDTSIQKQDFDSIGGFIINELGRMPSVGDTVQTDGINLKVLSVAGRRIKKVHVIRTAEPDKDGNGPPNGKPRNGS
jgi:putative hemolysin